MTDKTIPEGVTDKVHDDDCFLSGGDDGRWPCICEGTTRNRTPSAIAPEVVEALRAVCNADHLHEAHSVALKALALIEPPVDPEDPHDTRVGKPLEECTQEELQQQLAIIEAILAKPVDPDPIDELVELLAPVLTHGQGMRAAEREQRFRAAIKRVRAETTEARHDR